MEHRKLGKGISNRDTFTRIKLNGADDNRDKDMSDNEILSEGKRMRKQNQVQ